MEAIDGNEAAAHVAFGMSEFCFIYPITPSSPMAERADAWMGQGRKNCFGHVPVVYQMQSEAGAAGAMHGCGAAGGLATSFTSCQGLLLMIPNLYKIAGEQIPAVLHVAARQVGSGGTSIYSDHSDVMSVRMVGFAMVSSASVQEAMDLAAVCHAASIRSSIPFMHFFDGFQTSHSVASCNLIPYEKLKEMIDEEALARHRAAALDPSHPTQRGTVVTRGDWMQMFEASNPLYSVDVPAAVDRALADLERLTGRRYSTFEYTGAPDADRVVVAMGTGGLNVEDTVDEMVAEGEKVGVIRVLLFRPWSAERFLARLPKTARRVAVLDRTKEPGSHGEPLFLDVLASVAESPRAGTATVVGGRYGLADKAFTPAMVRAVFANLAAAEPRRRFVVGVDDDVTHLSLPVVPVPLPRAAAVVTQCTLWGMGSDGTVGAAQMAIKLVTGELHDGRLVYAQGQFHFTAHKSGGVTMSYLRFGPSPIKAAYPITTADYMACHHPSYVGKFPLLEACKPGAVLLINAPWAPTVDALDQKIPAAWRRRIAELGLRLFLVDALKISRSVGLGGHFNLVLLTAFFKLSGVLPVERAIPLLKDATQKQYAKKGEIVIKKNIDAIDQALSGLVLVDYPRDAWRKAADSAPASASIAAAPGINAEFEREIKAPLMCFQGDAVPVSKFAKLIPGGRAPVTTTRLEKRGVAPEVPHWLPEKCVQCGFCTCSCPHAAIRPFLLNEAEVAAAPAGMKVKQATGPQGAPYKFRIQVSPLDCIGCGVCASICPVKALEMRPFDEVALVESPNWDYCFGKLPNRAGVYPTDSARGSQFLQPLFEFCGACGGCGEAPHIKLVSQLFGDRAIAACASGCNVAYSFALGSNPYCTNPEGRGPASAHSLFEDTAEFGFGIARTRRVRREHYAEEVARVAATGVTSPELSALLTRWFEHRAEGAASEALRKAILPLLEVEYQKVAQLAGIWRDRELLTKASVWCIGGDGWANDIDYGGLDHVLTSTGEDLKVLVLDTEVYSNTGGQKSKGTPMGSVHKFEASGKGSHKKDLGAIFMMMGNIYVAQICMYANIQQALRAVLEAEAFPGPSLVIAYSPCIEHGIEGTDWVAQAKRAVDSGYWPLYRYNPLLRDQGKNPFALDAPLKPKITIGDFIEHENRFQRLVRENKARSQVLHKQLQEHTTERLQKLIEMAKPWPAPAASAPATAPAATEKKPEEKKP